MNEEKFYRLLNVGEIIKEGDEELLEFRNRWGWDKFNQNLKRKPPNDELDI